MNDPYSDPWTGVLHNKLHIEDADEFAQAEFTLVSRRDVQTGRAGVPGIYDLAHLQRFRRQKAARSDVPLDGIFPVDSCATISGTKPSNCANSFSSQSDGPSDVSTVYRSV